MIISETNAPADQAPQYDDPELIQQWIKKATDKYEWPMSRKDIKEKVFGEIGGQKNHARQNADLVVAINMNYLTESTLKKNGAYMLQPPEEMPF
jgi:hypothetical protein